MQVCQKDLPKLAITQNGIIYLKAGKREKNLQDQLPKIPLILQNILYILEYLDAHSKYKKVISKIEIPALTHLIKEEIFDGTISQRTAYSYSIFLKTLGRYAPFLW